MEEKRCLVSIMCTAYNHEKYIKQTLQSFVDQQTDFDFEVLVNDDCSTDGTAEIIREFECKYPDIIRPFYQKKNLYSQGLYITHAVFADAARGRYIAQCEGDDYWSDPTKLQRQVDFLEAHPQYSACVHNTTLTYCAADRPDKPLLHFGQDCDISIESVAKGVSYCFHTSAILAKKELMFSVPADLLDAGYRHGFGDHPEALWLLFNGPIRYIDRCMSVYRINSGAAAWSSGVDFEYAKLRGFVKGERETLETSLRYAPDDFKPAIAHEILEREFELMYIEGRDREQRRPPYDKLLRAKPFSYRAKNFIKAYIPGVQTLYRRKKGYID